MSRPRLESKIQIPPRIKGFMPMAYYANEAKPIFMDLEEFEAIRLLDYENLSQVQAAELMDISRPTLTRIYNRARKKIAKMLTEGCQLLIEGGKAIFEGDWYECISCNNRFNNPKNLLIEECIFCSGKRINYL